ncbi:MAG: hypothetical protein R2849_17040 [Thermomicrobiales bacterium]
MINGGEVLGERYAIALSQPIVEQDNVDRLALDMLLRLSSIVRTQLRR